MEINNRRYLGSKFKLIDFITDVVENHCEDVDVFYDVFSGTGVVANAYIDKTVITNDILYSNYISHYAWFNPSIYRKDYVDSMVDWYNSLDSITEDNYMTENFADTYFSMEVCRKIGFIREDIETRFNNNEMNFKEKSILITSLLYAMDKIANTVGHYDAYRKGIEQTSTLKLNYLNINNTLSEDNNCFNGDSNQISINVSSDIAYLDPPYNSRQYSDAYHVLENVAKWDKPEVFGDARKMDRTETKSRYCTNEAGVAMIDLISKLDTKYILLSYNNTGMKLHGRSNARISDIELTDILKTRGEVTIFSQKHNAFSTGKSTIEDNEELLYLCKVGEKKKYLQSPLNYTGGKHKLLPQLLKYFPEDIDVFVDLFCGGGNVGANVKANEYYYNDINEDVVQLLKLFKSTSYSSLIQKLDKLIIKFNLSDSTTHGYAHYNCNSSAGLGSYNKVGHAELRTYFNSLKKKDTNYYVTLFLLIMYSFNNQIRFNKSKEFNLPVGKRDFNTKMKDKLKYFTWKLQSQNSHLSSVSFEKMNTEMLTNKSLVYVDPPYLITTATYNEQGGWGENDEVQLLEHLNNLNSKGIRFALSNVLHHKGKTNSILLDWTNNHPEYKVIHLNNTYSNSNYQTDRVNTESDEVLIINY